MFATHPDTAQPRANETPSHDLSEKVGSKVKPHMRAKMSDPRIAGLQELQSMLSGAISDKLKAKKSAKLDRSKAKADAPETELGAEGEAADEKDPRAARRRAQFGHGIK